MEDKPDDQREADATGGQNDLSQATESERKKGFPTWAQIGGVLGGLAALVAILQFLGIANIYELKWRSGAQAAVGIFVSFRDTDFQIYMQNDTGQTAFISSSKLVLSSSTKSVEIGMDACCVVGANEILPRSSSNIFLRSRNSNSNFDFYHDVLLPFADEKISGNILIEIKPSEGTPYQLSISMSDGELTNWKNEKLVELDSWCAATSGAKPRWCS